VGLLEADGDRHRHRDGHAPCGFHNDALERSASGQLATFTPFTVSHAANDSSPMNAAQPACDGEDSGERSRMER
jgi:hypothetical protein